MRSRPCRRRGRRKRYWRTCHCAGRRLYPPTPRCPHTNNQVSPRRPRAHLLRGRVSSFFTPSVATFHSVPSDTPPPLAGASACILRRLAQTFGWLTLRWQVTQHRPSLRVNKEQERGSLLSTNG